MVYDLNILYMTGLCHGYDITNQVYLCHIYVYPSPTFCLRKWVQPGGWYRKSGAGPAAPEPPTMVLVCLVPSVISCMPKPAAPHLRDLPMWFLADLIVEKALVIRKLWKPVCHAVHNKYRHIESRLSKSSGWSKQAQLEMSGPHVLRASACKGVPK